MLDVIYEDAELLVVNKPADLVCHPTKGDVYSSLISRVRLHLGAASHPQLVNRLDRETTGLTLVAKTPEAARELRQLWEGREVAKEYLAIVHGQVAHDHGILDAPLGRDLESMVAIKDGVRPDGAPALTEYWVEKRFLRAVPVPEDAAQQGRRPFTLVRIRLHTGRKHQIRIHFAHAGHPIVGDKIYGGDEQLYLDFVVGRLSAAQWRKLILPNHALHSGRLRFTWRGKDWEFAASPEAWFGQFLAEPAGE